MTSEHAAKHREAADRHEAAAQSHDRAAGFWHGQGDSDRAALQRQLAQYERDGAELERRWAELDEPDARQGPSRATRAAELGMSRTRLSAERLSGLLTQIANELEKTAGLADEHAERRARAGQSRDAADERRAAQHARDAAKRARSQAAEWLRLGEI